MLTVRRVPSDASIHRATIMLRLVSKTVLSIASHLLSLMFRAPRYRLADVFLLALGVFLRHDADMGSSSNRSMHFAVSTP